MDWDNKQIQQNLANQAARVKNGSGTFASVSRVAKPVEPAADRGPGFFTNVGRSVSKIPGAVGGFVKDVGVESFRQIDRVQEGIVTGLYASKQLDGINKRLETLDKLEQTIYARYRNGQMSKQEFDQFLKDAAEDRAQLNAELEGGDIASFDAKQFTVDAFSTGLTPFAFGKLGSVKQAGALTVTGKAAPLAPTTGRALAASQKVESWAAKIPSLSKPLAGSRQGTIPGNVVAGIIKKPLLIDAIVEEPFEVHEAMKKGEFGRAAVVAGFIATGYYEGGPLGLAIKGGGKLRETIKLSLFGKKGMFDIISEKGGMQGPSLVQYVSSLDPSSQEYNKAIRALKSLQAMNLNQFKGDEELAADFIIGWQKGHGRPISSMTASELLQDMEDYVDAAKAANKLAKLGAIKGVKPNQAGGVAVGKFGREEQNVLIEQLEKAPDFQSRLKLVNEMIAEGVSWTHNSNMRTFILKAIGDDDFARQIKKFRTQEMLELDPKIAKQYDKFFKNGYFPILPKGGAKTGFIDPDEAGDVVSKWALADLDGLEKAAEPIPVLGAIGGALKRFGLSPEDTNKAAYASLKVNVGRNLDDLTEKAGIKIKGVDTTSGETASKKIVDDLTHYVNSRRELYDIRQLTVTEIVNVLGVTRGDARKIRGAVTQAFLQIPLQLRGLGDRIQDINIRVNPFAAMYSRVQGAARYAYNPFFRTQERFETEILGQVMTGGKQVQFPGVNAVRRIFFKNDEAEVGRIVNRLDDMGVFSFGGFGREVVDDVALGKITANIGRSQKESLAGMVQTVARRQNVSVDELLDNQGEEVIDMLRVAVQYPSKSILNSSMAKTLNLVAFPVRYNLKVASIAAKALAQEPTVVQFAFLKSLSDMSDWLETDEGIMWQSEHSEVLGVLSYFSPLDSINQVYRTLSGKNEAPADFGLIGGLPFGVIGQILDGQGLIRMNTPYLHPKTGEALPDYIPVDNRARAQAAITDLLMSMFTYPGRMLGLPGKGSTVRSLTEPLGGEFVRVERDDLTDRQRHIQKVLGGGEPEINPAFDGPAFDLTDLPELSEDPELFEPLPEVPKRQRAGRRETPLARPPST